MPFRLKTILVATDLSESALPVLRTASALAALAEAELHVIHALEPAARNGSTGPSPGRAAAARATLDEQLRQALPQSATAHTARVEIGRPHEVILQQAEYVRADLIVIGPHRARSGTRQVLGTTADRLVRTADIPCLIVHQPLELPLRRVLVPSDLSDAANGALDVALIWAAALRLPTATGRQTHVEIAHVLSPIDVAETGTSDPATIEQQLHEQVTAACDRTGCAPRLALTETVLEDGAAADAILRIGRDTAADLIVMGTHGESAQVRALIGSVSSAVARQTECPVLLVPPALWKERQAREEAILRARP